MIENWTEIVSFSEQITKAIGSQLIKDFGQVQAEKKGDGSLVTRADKWSDQQLRNAILSQFPDHGVLTEETEHILPENDFCWVVDPIDGTTNFTRGLPLWAISLGLLYRGTPVFGAVYLPQLQHFFHGFYPGNSGLNMPEGAFLNHTQIYTSKEQPSGSHLFNLCARSTDILKQPFPCKIRMIGVATYNCLLVACGASLGGVEATPKIWDIAAVWAIVKAAGGEFVALEPKPVFPLETGKDYGDRPFPSLVVARSELIPVFKPLVEFIGEKVRLN